MIGSILVNNWASLSVCTYEQTMLKLITCTTSDVTSSQIIKAYSWIFLDHYKFNPSWTDILKFSWIQVRQVQTIKKTCYTSFNLSFSTFFLSVFLFIETEGATGISISASFFSPSGIAVVPMVRSQVSNSWKMSLWNSSKGLNLRNSRIF